MIYERVQNKLSCFEKNPFFVAEKNNYTNNLQNSGPNNLMQKSVGQKTDDYYMTIVLIYYKINLTKRISHFEHWKLKQSGSI